MDRDNLDLLNKSKTPGYCGFPLANLQKGPSVYCVPKSNPFNSLILLYICSANQTKSRTQDMVCGFFNLGKVKKG
jgi:hypothetical protein